MEWYSLFFISLPEIYALFFLVSVLFDLEIRKSFTRFNLMNLAIALFTFFATILIHNPNVKIYVTLAIYYIFIQVFYRMRWQHTLLITIVSGLIIMAYEVAFGVLTIIVTQIDYKVAIENPITRIFLAWPSMIAMFISGMLLQRTKIRIKIKK